MSCGSSIKQIEVKEISDVQFMGIEDNQIILKSELILYNPNNKNLRASQVYSKIYFNTKFFGEFENFLILPHWGSCRLSQPGGPPCAESRLTAPPGASAASWPRP